MIYSRLVLPLAPVFTSLKDGKGEVPSLATEEIMSRSIGTGRAAIALAMWSQACVVHRPVPADASFRSGTDLRIRSVAPLELTRQTDSRPARTVCCETSVEGKFVRTAGDTIVLERGSGVAISSNLNRTQGYHELLTVTRKPGTEVTVRQVDRGRTTLLVLGIAAALVGLAAYAASQIEYSWPTGNGNTY